MLTCRPWEFYVHGQRNQEISVTENYIQISENGCGWRGATFLSEWAQRHIMKTPRDTELNFFLFWGGGGVVVTEGSIDFSDWGNQSSPLSGYLKHCIEIIF